MGQLSEHLRSRREVGVRRQDTNLLLPLEDRLASFFPAHVELAAILIDPLGRGVVRGVTGSSREVQEERLGGIDIAEVGKELDRPVSQVRGQVVAFFCRVWLVDEMVVGDQLRVVLIGVATEEAVIALEATPKRPAVSGRRHVHLDLRREVPLPHRVGGVAVVAQERDEHLGRLDRRVAIPSTANDQGDPGPVGLHRGV